MHQYDFFRISNLPGAECIEELPEKNLVTGLIDGRIVQIKQSATGHIGEGDIELIRNIVFPDAPKTTDDMSHGRPLGQWFPSRGARTWR